MLDPERQIDAACPECGTTLQETKDGEDVYCPLPGCEWHNDAPGVPENKYNTDSKSENEDEAEEENRSLGDVIDDEFGGEYMGTHLQGWG